MDVSEFKKKLIERCNSFYQRTIYEAYKPHTQVNISLGIEGDAVVLKNYIKNKQTSFQALKAAINKLNSISIKDNFLTGSDEDMKQYVAGLMQDLNDDDQKLAMVSALQEIR